MRALDQLPNHTARQPPPLHFRCSPKMRDIVRISKPSVPKGLMGYLAKHSAELSSDPPRANSPSSPTPACAGVPRPTHSSSPYATQKHADYSQHPPFPFLTTKATHYFPCSIPGGLTSMTQSTLSPGSTLPTQASKSIAEVVTAANERQYPSSGMSPGAPFIARIMSWFSKETSRICEARSIAALSWGVILRV